MRWWSSKCPQWRCLFLPGWPFICSRPEGEAQALGFSPEKAPWASPAHCRKPGGCPPHPSFMAGHRAGGLLQSLPFSHLYRALGHSTWLRSMGWGCAPSSTQHPLPRGSCWACLRRRRKPHHIRHSQLRQWKNGWRAGTQTGLAASKAAPAFLPPSVPLMGKRSHLLQLREQLLRWLRGNRSCRSLPEERMLVGLQRQLIPKVKVNPVGTCLY